MTEIRIFVYAAAFATSAAESVDYSCAHSASWRMNQDDHTASNFGDVKTDVTSSAIYSASWMVGFNRIPNYDREFAHSDISTLNSRPEAATDFTSGATTAAAGNIYEFGDDIGYAHPGQSCSLGYWPPGPGCPTASTQSKAWDLNPAPESRAAGCYMPVLGSEGVWVNGVSIFGWSDGQSYNNQNIWYNSAVEFEVYDLDLCGGHAANGEYHHHNFPNCIQNVLGDSGSSHSPIYGWLFDSFPVYGPYQSENTLAVPCWQKRDYDSSSPTGCSNNQRCCQLQDEYDYTAGTTAVTCGPSLTGTVTTQSGNTISAASGIYYEDYFFNSTCAEQGGEFLDSHNGHDHDGYGYHYHVTIDIDRTPLFPYIAGPKYYGCRSTCCGSRTSSVCSATSICGAEVGTSVFSCSVAQSPTSVPTSSPTAAPTAPTSLPTSEPTSPTYSPTIESGKDNDASGLSAGTVSVIIGCSVAAGVLILIAGLYVGGVFNGITATVGNVPQNGNKDTEMHGGKANL